MRTIQTVCLPRIPGKNRGFFHVVLRAPLHGGVCVFFDGVSTLTTLSGEDNWKTFGFFFYRLYIPKIKFAVFDT